MPIGLSATDDIWFQGKNKAGAALERLVISNPDQITTDQNNYQLQNGATFFRLSSNSIVSITGFEAPVAPYTGVIRLANVGSYNIQIPHNSSSSSSNNRVFTTIGMTVILTVNGILDMTYDYTSLCWRANVLDLQMKSFDTPNDFPAVGSPGVYYFALDYGMIFAWNGSVYYEQGPDPNYINIPGALYARRSDVVGYTSYTGKAVYGSLDSDSVWTIRKTVYTSAGTVSSTTTATNVKWDDRLTATYS
jgi:hypothetical protein